MSPLRLVFALIPGLLGGQSWSLPVTHDAAHHAPLARHPSVEAFQQKTSPAPTARDAAKPTREFVFFDATSYKQKPDLAPYGLRPISMVFKFMMWPVGRDGDSLPDRDMVRQAALQVSKSTGVAVLDIEQWPLTGPPAVVAESIQKYETLIRWFKEAAPSVKVGYYGVVPVTNYWDAIEPTDSPGYTAWQKLNDRLIAVARIADIIFPSVYTYYEDQAGWLKYAVQQIKEARRYNEEKPVYVFLWAQYHPSEKKLAWTYLQPQYWRMELETARRYADGVVIWGGYTETWDETAPWWQETKSFLQATRSGGQ